MNDKKMKSGKCDIFNNSDKINLRLEMPGVSKENLDIKIEGDLLTIRGDIDNINNKDNYLLHEINGSDYLHEYTIDETIDKNSIQAEMKNGVLLLTLDLKKSEKPRKIEVKPAKTE